MPRCLDLLFLASLSLLFPACSDLSAGTGGPGNMGPHPSPEFRSQQIASEQKGDFYYGRRYYVEKTRFWGYLREPGKQWDTAKLVLMNERRTRQPDRLPEYGAGKTYGFDQNYDYRVYGNYSGRTLYEPNSNQFLPEFVPTRFEVLNTDPGWLFSPSDRFNPVAITLRPR